MAGHKRYSADILGRSTINPPGPAVQMGLTYYASRRPHTSNPDRVASGADVRETFARIGDRAW